MGAATCSAVKNVMEIVAKERGGVFFSAKVCDATIWLYSVSHSHKHTGTHACAHIFFFSEMADKPMILIRKKKKQLSQLME